MNYDYDEDMEELDLFEDEEKNKETEDKKENKTNRSYMLTDEALANLKRLEIEYPTKNKSDIVNMAINKFYESL